jgi:hypothetical protein
MTVALVLAGERRAGQGLSQDANVGVPFNEQLAALGVSRVDAAEHGAQAMVTVAAAARGAGDRVLICDGQPPVAELARLIHTGGTAAVAGPGQRVALLVHPDDLGELAEAADDLALNYRRPADPVGALLGELASRGVTVRVIDGTSDGQVADLVTDPAAADMARWAGERELTPAALYGIFLGLGLLSAVWFSELALRAKAFGVILLFAAFVTARAGQMLDVTIRAQGGHRSPAAVWFRLSSAIIVEFGLYAGIAASATIVVKGGANAGAGLSGIFGPALNSIADVGGQGATGVWRLAITAMLLLAVRQMADRCATIAGVETSHSKIVRLICLPSGERLTVLCASVIFVGARFAFIAGLGWGALAFGYTLTRLFTAPQLRPGGPEIAAARGDGPLSLALGRLVAGRIPPLLPLLVGLLVTCMLTALGLGNLPGILVLTPVAAMLLAGLGSWHPHDTTGDWIVPAVLQAGEYIYLAALAFAHHVSAPVTIALVSAVVLRHFELACRARIWPAGPRQDDAGFGWEGRMIVAGIAAFFGIVPLGFAILAGWVWLVLIRDFLTQWLPSGYWRRPPEELHVVKSTSPRRPAV